VSEDRRCRSRGLQMKKYNPAVTRTKKRIPASPKAAMVPPEYDGFCVPFVGEIGGGGVLHKKLVRDRIMKLKEEVQELWM